MKTGAEIVLKDLWGRDRMFGDKGQQFQRVSAAKERTTIGTYVGKLFLFLKTLGF